MKTQKQIDKEITTLRKIKLTLRRQSAFGDNHHDAIDAQINVLENKMSETRAFDKYPMPDEEWYSHDEFPENVHSAANEAARWLADEKTEPPSKGWKGLY